MPTLAIGGKRKMTNKYKVFIEITYDLEEDRNKQSCISLLKHSNIYYSYYRQYQELVRVKRKLLHIYKLKNNMERPILKANVLDIRYRLFLEFYLQLLKENYLKISNVNFMELIKGYEDELSDLLDSYGVKSEKIGRKTLYEWIAKSCRIATDISMQKKTKHRPEINLGMENIRNAIKIFYANLTPQDFSEEESFNAIFSERFIKYIAYNRKYREPILYMCIAPVNMRLFDSEIAAKSLNNDSWKWCFEKDYRRNLRDLKKEIHTIQKYDAIFSDFMKISNKLDLLINNIEKNP